MKIITQLTTIIVAILILFAILNTTLINYLPYILAIVISLAILYFLVKKRFKRDQEVFTGSNIEVFTIIEVILLTIFLTDGLNSPIFFLVYFIIFGIAFLFEPVMVFIFLIAIVTLFVQQYFERNVYSYWLQFTMLLSAAPISYFFGKEFKRREDIDRKISETTSTIIKEANELKKSPHHDKHQENSHLDTIIEESKKLSGETKK